MTLEQLAQATGLNKGFLSRIENDAKTPSIDTLLKLARTLDVSVGQLFGEQIDDAEIHLVRAQPSKGPEPKKGYAFVPLSPPGQTPRTEAFLMYPPLRFKDTGQAEHSGEESLFVVEGQIEIKFADRTLSMTAGDYLQFPGHLVHQMRRIGPRATILIVVSKS